MTAAAEATLRGDSDAVEKSKAALAALREKRGKESRSAPAAPAKSDDAHIASEGYK